MKRYDLFVIGSGPAGQKAAIQATKAGCRVALCEQLKEVGGACVHQGTIPSKALWARALIRRGNPQAEPIVNVAIAELIGEVGGIMAAHDRYMTEQLTRNGVEILHGRASFDSDRLVQVRKVNGQVEHYEARNFLIATGSVPRQLSHIPIDHEHLYDSDSVLSLAYLPESLVVLGGGVIACEYASIFAMLGVKVTLVDRSTGPLGFLDNDLTTAFLDAFARMGGIFIGNVEAQSVDFDGISAVETRLGPADPSIDFAGDLSGEPSGEHSVSVIRSEKVLCALGRISQVEGLQLKNTGVELNERKLVQVNGHGQTSVPHIYAAGDVVGPPSLASASMEQGRRAACHMLDLDPGCSGEWIPTGIYAVPELASVGLTETAARNLHADVVVGYAYGSEIARGHIAGARDGLLKLVVSGDRRIRGVHIVGSHATDLIHLGQMALIHGDTLDVFIENVFNFPTYAESYRVAALSAAAALSGHSAAHLRTA